MVHCRGSLFQYIFGCLVDYKEDAGGDAGDGDDSSRDDDDDVVDLVIAVDRLRDDDVVDVVDVDDVVDAGVDVVDDVGDDDVDLVIAVDRLRGGAHFLILLQRSTPAPSD